MMKRRAGFTLVELLITVSIFSVIIFSIYSAFHTGLLSYNKTESAFQLYQTARIIFNRIDLDLKNTFSYSKDNSRFKADIKAMDFFSLLDSFDQAGNVYAGIQHIKYEFSEGVLKRIYYKGQDALKENPDLAAKEQSFDVEDISFQYATGKTDTVWQESWPKEDDANQQKTLPLAVKIELTLKEKTKQQTDTKGSIILTKIVSLLLSTTDEKQ